MPGFCTPWPGNSSAMGPARLINLCLNPLEERRAPCQPRTKAGQQHVVALLDPTLAERFLQGQWNRGARRVAVLVDVDRNSVEGQPDPARGRVDDPEVGLVRNPEVDLVHGDAGRVRNLMRLA